MYPWDLIAKVKILKCEFTILCDDIALAVIAYSLGYCTYDLIGRGGGGE
jgi:hypothetical protein